jgi:septin 7
MATEVKKLTGFVGFANLPNQVHRRSVKQGFQFTLLVVGEAGLGKSTFINALFNTQIYPKKTPKPLTKDTPSAVEIQGYSCDLEESGVKLKLNVLDAVGFGDFLNNEKSWQPILKCVEERYDAYLDQERRVNRKNIVDNRIHCCLYFISPTGHSLKALDVEFMKRLHERVNIIPVIAKSDTLSEEERIAFKKRVLADLEYHKINVYQVAVDPTDDEETKKRDTELRAAHPFAAVGSNREYEVNGKKVRARKYPWGLIEIENENHCDFVKLRSMLVKSHMEDLRAKTVEALYENYRTQKLESETGGSGKKVDGGPLAQFEEEKKKQEASLAKYEKEMKNEFETRVKEKEERLKKSEEKLLQDYNERKADLEKQLKEQEEKRRNLEEQLKAPEKKGKKKSGLF